MRNTPPEAAFRVALLVPPGWNIKIPVLVEEIERVPLFRSLGRGTVEHPFCAAENVERSAEQDAERW